MPIFGTNSKRHRDSCHPDLIRVLDEAIKHYDFSVIWGHRDRESQRRAYLEGNSQLDWPKSNHNKKPSRAFDVVPYPGGFSNEDEEFYVLATHILRAASVCGVPLTWGGHWRSLRDLAHFELSENLADTHK